MIVRVPDIPTEGLSVTDASALGAVYRDPAWRLLDVNLRLERDGADVFLTGQVRAAVTQACGRCLEPSPGEVTADLDVRLVPRPATADNVELGADDLDVDFYDKDEIDISALIDAETTLALPMTDEDWDRVMEVNLRSAFLMTRAVSKALVRQKSGGRVINITSTAGAMGNAGQANYSAAKAGLIGFTKATARELAHWSILVNAVAPGLIETDMTKDLSANAREALLAQVPLKRSGTAREVAEMVRFLAGDGATYITGQVFHVNGGLYM